MNTNAAVVSPVKPSWLLAFPEMEKINDTAWLSAMQTAKEMTVPAVTQVVHKGDPCQNFLLVSRGTIRVFEKSDNGREIVLYRTCAGELCILTLNNLLAGTDYAAEAVTEDEVHVISIPMPSFQSALAGSEMFRSFIMGTLARRLNDTMQVVEQVTFRRLDLRLACLLGRLFERQRGLPVTMTHQELAGELGTTREVTSRILKDFERMGCIRLQRGRIELLSQETLTRLSAGNDM